MQKLKTISTVNYLDAILEGNKNEISSMYEKYFPFILSLVSKYGGSEDDAKDIFQEAIMLVYYKASQADFKLTSQFKTYFFGICRNLWGNRIQLKSFRNVTIPYDAKYIDENQNDCNAERRLLFDRAFRQLNVKCQKLLNLFFEKLTMKKIAKQLGFKSEGYARRRKHQCKERLVELVKRQPGYDELCLNEKKY